MKLKPINPTNKKIKTFCPVGAKDNNKSLYKKNAPNAKIPVFIIGTEILANITDNFFFLSFNNLKIYPEINPAKPVLSIHKINVFTIPYGQNKAIVPGPKK